MNKFRKKLKYYQKKNKNMKLNKNKMNKLIKIKN